MIKIHFNDIYKNKTKKYIRSIICEAKMAGQSDFAENKKILKRKLPSKLSHNEKVA